MNKLLLICILYLSAFAITLQLNAQHSGEIIPGELLVQLRQSNDIQQLEKSFAVVDFHKKEIISKRLNIFLVSFDQARVNETTLLSSLKSEPNVVNVQFNHRVELRESTENTPNDTDFGQQWNMNNTGQNGGLPGADIDALRAWDITTGGVTVFGDTIVVAVIDGGTSLSHNDQNLFKNHQEIPDNGIDDDENGYLDDYDGWNACGNNGTVPDHQHGSHVCGIVGARGNNGTGITGISWNVKVLPIAGSSTQESTVIRAYSYAFDMRSLYDETNGQKGAFIVATNSSFGINNGQPDDYPIWGAMYDSLGSLGILNAGATANGNVDVDIAGDIPTAFDTPWLITVTNTTNQDEKFTSAGYGATTIDLAAPGTQIYSTLLNNTYGLKSGTSMASPHVAGATALLFAAADSAFITAYKANPAEKILAIKQFLLQGTDPLPSLQGRTVSGGRLNLYNSLMLMQQPIEVNLDIDTLQFTFAVDSSGNDSFTVKNNGSDTILMHLSIPEGITWLSISPDSTGIAPADSAVFNVDVNTIGLEPGFYHTVVQLFTNDFYFKSLEINLEVYQQEFAINTDSIFILVPINTLADTQLKITNPMPVSCLIHSTIENTVQWITMNPETLTIQANDSGLITFEFNTNGLSVGNYTTVAILDAGAAGLHTVFVSLQVYDPSAIAESNETNIQVFVSPNPFSEIILFQIDKSGSGPFVLEIRNNAGQIVYSRLVKQVENRVLIDWNGCTPNGKICAEGAYFYSISRNGKTISGGRILKQ
ncbi:MAG: S8 family serine peptidase [Bacteroidales bacterium]|nr:S8 family serine peptidase [Bacteroidales bacterium]